ncbi:MAG: YbaB/EbfC family nucleoid-associated protein [bacterium]|jgi:DNA-binding YbaB/EbfC family protein|nr:YbaB/EbfC family nucleoid-associated protein [bacterium]
MGTGFGKFIKQTKMMKESLEKMQQEMETREVEASAGGGAVKATARGDGRLVSVKIDPEVVKSGDVEMLEDLILTAANQALEKATKLDTSELDKISGDLGILGKLGLGG